MSKKNRAWRGKPKKLDLVCLFVPDFVSLRRLDCGSTVGDVGRVLGPAGQRAMERMLASTSGDITSRQWKTQTNLLRRLVHEYPDSLNAKFVAWLEPLLDLGCEARFEQPILSWDLIRLAQPSWVGETERLLYDHWALLQQRGQILLESLDFGARLAGGNEVSALRDLATGIRTDPLLLPYWSEAALEHIENSGTAAALDLARATAFVQGLVSQLGLVQALQDDAKPHIHAMLELDSERGFCNPGGVLLQAVREALKLPTVESLVEIVQSSGCKGPDRSTLMAWSSGRQFPSKKLWCNMSEALRSPSDPEFRGLPGPLRRGTLGWAARRIHALRQTFGQHWAQLKPFVGEADSLAAWLGPSVDRWHHHWVANPLPLVELPMLPSRAQ